MRIPPALNSRLRSCFCGESRPEAFESRECSEPRDGVNLDNFLFGRGVASSAALRSRLPGLLFLELILLALEASGVKGPRRRLQGMDCGISDAGSWSSQFKMPSSSIVRRGGSWCERAIAST